MNKWNMQKVLQSHTRSVIILTIILTFAFNKLLNKILTREIILEEGLYSSHTVEFSLGVYGIILAIPAGLFSIWLIKLILNKRNIQPNPVDRAGSFKWHRIYGTVIGFIIFFITIEYTFNGSLDADHVGEAIIQLGIVIGLPGILAILSAKIINKVMIQKEPSNSGNGNSRNSNSMRGLQTPPLWESHLMQEADRQQQERKRKEEADFADKQRLQAEAQRLEQIRKEEADFANKQRLQAEAQWQAKKRQEEADFAKRRAIEQAQYNSRTHYFQEKVNLANAKQREADAAAKRARKF
ncbi:hypothetical protein [Alkalicoccus daliensis]|uniref:Uncharacterized protein n=1 Tax=Alkalicoccus daliensis TaxID=745820 RepID=A0A1H0E8Z1_9BACI|nr:hypothetical protein [Alkalicoccus daliensis]SDN78756.1 hypothetical protein SAMN04488053_103247 [Alkalicoccus daliensis]